jgi:hypothetical protein
MVHQQKHLEIVGVMQVQVAQAEGQQPVQVFARNIQYQQEQAFQVKVIQAVLITSHTLNMLVEQGVEVLVQQVAMVFLLDLNQQFLYPMLHL